MGFDVEVSPPDWTELVERGFLSRDRHHRTNETAVDLLKSRRGQAGSRVAGATNLSVGAAAGASFCGDVTTVLHLSK